MVDKARIDKITITFIRFVFTYILTLQLLITGIIPKYPYKDWMICDHSSSGDAKLTHTVPSLLSILCRI